MTNDFDESKHRRDQGGKFASKGPAAEATGVELSPPAGEPGVSELRREMAHAHDVARRAAPVEAAAAARYLRGCFPGAATVTATTGRERDTPSHLTEIRDGNGKVLWDRETDQYNGDVSIAEKSLQSSGAFDRVSPDREWTSPRKYTPPPGQGFSAEMRNADYDLERIEGLAPRPQLDD